MLKPNYKDGSIVNLMSSIARACGGRTEYNPLAILPPEKIKNSKNIVLMVIDGLGFEYLSKTKDNFLKQNLKGKITSVFPPTTASAITTFSTGAAPQQHAFTGWFMHLKELGVVSTILPFNPRFGGPSFSSFGVEMGEILPEKCFPSKIKVNSHVIIHKDLMQTDFTRYTSGKAKISGYRNLADFFAQTAKAVKSNNKRKYVYAYWPDFDTLSHEYGTAHKKTHIHFWELEKGIKKFWDKIKNTNTELIITADHGLISTPAKRVIHLADHPKLAECLTLPICGDDRTSYLYAHPSKTAQLEEYVKTKLSKYCVLFKSEELIHQGFFGLFKPSKQLHDRIGDYALMMKENYVMRDGLMGRRRSPNAGNHGGLSKEELFVPLIIIN